MLPLILVAATTAIPALTMAAAAIKVGDGIADRRDARERHNNKTRNRNKAVESGLAAARRGDAPKEVSPVLGWSSDYGVALLVSEEGALDRLATEERWEDFDFVLSAAASRQRERWKLLGLSRAPEEGEGTELVQVPHGT